MTGRPKSRLLRGIRLYWLLVSASVRARMQYKFDFIASSIIQAVMGAYDYFVVAVILWKFRSIRGWDIWEIGILYAVSRIGFGIYRTMGEELERFENYIVRGDFDSVLLRPWPSLFVLLSRNVDIGRVSWIIQGAALGWISAVPLLRSGELTWAGVGQLGLACVWTACLYIAVSIVTAAAAFKIVRIEELQVFTINAGGTATLYPLEIYPGWLRYVLLSVIPLGVGNYIPVRYILGKGGTWLSLVLPPVAAVLSLLVATKVWRLGESRYHSTGS